MPISYKQRYRYACAWHLTWLDLQSLELIPMSCLGNGRTTKVKCQVYSCSNFLKLSNSIKNKKHGCKSGTSKGIAMLVLVLVLVLDLTWLAVPRADTSVLFGGLIAMSKAKCQVYSCSNFQNVSNSIKNKKHGCKSGTSKGIAMLVLVLDLTWLAVPRADTSVLFGGLIAMSKAKCQVYSCSNFQNVSNSIKNKKHGCTSGTSKGIAMLVLLIGAWHLAWLDLQSLELIHLSCLGDW